MAKLIIDIKDKTKERIMRMIRDKARELGVKKLTQREFFLKAIGISDE